MKALALARKIAKLQAKLAKTSRKCARVRREFDKLPQLETHRSHGWLTLVERLQMYYFASNGVPAKEIARKFDVSEPTVYLYKRRKGL